MSTSSCRHQSHSFPWAACASFVTATFPAIRQLQVPQRAGFPQREPEIVEEELVSSASA
jgi:hypothetical protein